MVVDYIRLMLLNWNDLLIGRIRIILKGRKKELGKK